MELLEIIYEKYHIDANNVFIHYCYNATCVMGPLTNYTMSPYNCVHSAGGLDCCAMKKCFHWCTQGGGWSGKCLFLQKKSQLFD